MDISELEILKDKLPSNYVAELAKRSGLSESLVIKVMNGDRINDHIIDKAIEWAEEIEKAKSERSNRIKNLCSQQES